MVNVCGTVIARVPTIILIIASMTDPAVMGLTGGSLAIGVFEAISNWNARDDIVRLQLSDHSLLIVLH